MAESSSFTDKERAAWHKERRERNRSGLRAELEFDGGPTCIHCGTPIAGVPAGYEGALCNACE